MRPLSDYVKLSTPAIVRLMRHDSKLILQVLGWQVPFGLRSYKIRAHLIYLDWHLRCAAGKS